LPAELAELARSYRPSVNVAQAPRLLGPIPFVVAGWVALVVAAIRVALLAPDLAFGAFRAPAVVLTVHVVTLGFLTLTMTGLLYQWVPVVFDVPPLPLGWMWLQGGLYAVGLSLFLAGWGVGVPDAVIGGAAGLATALALFVTLVANRVAASRRPRDAVHVGLILALTGITATWVLGFLLATESEPPWALGLHIVTAIGAWVATLVATVQLKLVPMFTMSRVTRPSPGPEAAGCCDPAAGQCMPPAGLPLLKTARR